MNLTDQQDDMEHLAIAGQDVALKGARGVGMTVALANTIVALMKARPGISIALVAPARRQLTDVLLRQVDKMMPRSVKGAIARIGESAAEVWTGEAEQVARFKGAPYRAVVIENAERVSESVLYKIEAAFGHRVQTIMAGCPSTRTGILYQAFRWNGLSATATQSPFVSPDFINRIKAQFGEDSDYCRAYVEAKWPKEAAL